MDKSVTNYLLDSINFVRQKELLISKLDSHSNKIIYKLNVNAREIFYRDTLDKYHDNKNELFAYAYVDSITEKVCISVKSIFWYQVSYSLDFFIKNDTQFNYAFTLLHNDKVTAVDKNDKCTLILDKAKYEVGDTINGIAIYQGINSVHPELRRKIKVFFQCRLENHYPLPLGGIMCKTG